MRMLVEKLFNNLESLMWVLEQFRRLKALRTALIYLKRWKDVSNRVFEQFSIRSLKLKSLIMAQIERWRYA